MFDKVINGVAALGIAAASAYISGSIFLADTANATKPGTLINGAGLCLDAYGPTRHKKGGKVRMWRCNAGKNQIWRWGAIKKEIRLGNGMCLDARRSQARKNGGEVMLWKCHGGKNQKWKYKNGRFVNGMGLCLDARRSQSTRNGGEVIVWKCHNKRNQQWTRGKNGKNSELINKAHKQIKKWKPVIEQLYAATKVISIKQIKALAKAQNPREFQLALESHPRVQVLYGILQRTGFRTMTVGLESSVGVGAGYARETGASLDVYQREGARLYAANSGYGGFVANVGNEVVFSAYKAGHRHIGGPAKGIMIGLDLVAGFDVTVWFDSNFKKPTGFSINIGAGSAGGGAAVVSAKTRVY